MGMAFEKWAVVELMGHVRMAGRVTEEERFGAVMGRIDIPSEGDTFTTQYFNGSSIYRVTPVSEEAARAMAKSHQPRPVYDWELPKLAAAQSETNASEATDGDDDMDGVF
jgi:hypothetical protein